MSEERQYGTVEDFTLPFLVSAGVLVFLGLSALWVAYGFLPTLILAWAAERVLARVRNR